MTCCRCGRDKNDDGSPVTWRCTFCEDVVCRRCTLVDPAERTYYEETYCSLDCRRKHLQYLRDIKPVKEVMES